jgi:phage terminase small subunit
MTALSDGDTAALPSRREVAEAETWGELGPAMRELTELRRNFVRCLLTEKPSHGMLTRAARRAGYNNKGSPKSLSKYAHRLRHHPKVIAAIQEEVRKLTRGTGYAEAFAALMGVIRDPTHRDHVRAISMIIDRADPVESKHSIDVTHRTIDPDREALEELKAARAIGATREKLIELFGANGLDRIEALEAVENAQRAASAKLIEGKVNH